MFKIEYSPMALEDLQQIRDYISAQWGEDAATRVLRKITADIRKLEEFHKSGVDLGKVIDVPIKYRYILSEKNYMFYFLEPESVRIIRVLNEQQDFIKHLF